MGKDLYDTYPEARDLYDQADEQLGFPLTDLCFNGPDERLTETRYTQPALYVHSVILHELLKKAGGRAHMVAGHSLGEYSALTAAGALTFADGLRCVQKRGELMFSAGNGAMAAIIGLDPDTLTGLCEKVESETGAIVRVANYNSPAQLVISGEPEGVAAVSTAAKEAGAKRAVPLNVSGAFHSPLMQQAAETFGAVLQSVVLNTPEIPVYCNATAEPTQDVDILKLNLEKQMTSPVLWARTMTRMIEDGAERFTEVGSGAVLSGLLKRIDRGVDPRSISTAADLTVTD